MKSGEKLADLRELTDDEVRTRVTEAQEELFRLRFRSATQELENPALLSTLRRDVARMKTVLRQRELGRSAAEQGAEQGTSRKGKPKGAPRKGNR